MTKYLSGYYKSLTATKQGNGLQILKEEEFNHKKNSIKIINTRMRT